ncbi:IS1595 family transposase [Microvirga puerhi]|uniref:IS1595 family transposase n=1 Tax=Microvirga puerhi TaxID=2876078 RepID=A0ABS7VL23_9HYPH|nr:IS1595 family transposase [Microvirga puerhi]MBZ6076199.1 IS1595 family transposase [Microvirga puerhi]
MNYVEYQKKFPTEQTVINHFIQIRYGSSVPHCHLCGGVNRVVPERGRPKFFHCNDCNSSFSVFKDTIFEKSSTDLRDWMFAIHLFLNGKKGISAYQLKREVPVTYKTAWRMLKQIRIAMGNVDKPEFAQTIIEIDETYVGGKPRKENRRKDDDGNPTAKSKRGRGTSKTPVVGVLDRTTKKIHARVAVPNKNGQMLTGKQLLDVLHQVVKGKSTVMTDEFSGYKILAKTEHLHFRIDHTKAFADGFVHTNNVENFWGNVKRGIIGIYHQVSKHYLQSYIDEFCFRHNNRKNENMFDTLLGQCVMKKVVVHSTEPELCAA